MFAHTRLFFYAHCISSLSWDISKQGEREVLYKFTVHSSRTSLHCVCVCMNIHDLFMHIYVSSDFFLRLLFQSASLSRHRNGSPAAVLPEFVSKAKPDVKYSNCIELQ